MAQGFCIYSLEALLSSAMKQQWSPGANVLAGVDTAAADKRDAGPTDEGGSQQSKRAR